MGLLCSGLGSFFSTLSVGFYFSSWYSRKIQFFSRRHKEGKSEERNWELDVAMFRRAKVSDGVDTCFERNSSSSLTSIILYV